MRSILVYDMMILRASEKFLIIIIFITLNMNREYYKLETVIISLEEKIKPFRFKINNASTYYKYLNII